MLRTVTSMIKLYYEVLTVGYFTVNLYTHIGYLSIVHFNIVTITLLNFTWAIQIYSANLGILCGQCQQDLSTIYIFSSFDCQQCSNVYFFLIILIAVSGLLMMIAMFVLNLTVSEGTITLFILYVNILSIHDTSLFQLHSLVKPLHVFIFMTNLNLGIRTCFYNGMDDYAKTWLQFSFTTYLIMIITSIIIASHYSIIIQRLTLHKTVSVLATILLLSYTKILQTTAIFVFHNY